MRGGVPLPRPRPPPRAPAKARQLSPLSPNIKSKVDFFQRQQNNPAQMGIMGPMGSQQTKLSLTGARDRFTSINRSKNYDYTGSTNVQNRIKIYNRKIVNENKNLSKHQKSLFFKLPDHIQARITLDHNMKALQDNRQNLLLQNFIKTNNIKGIENMFPEKLPTYRNDTALPNPIQKPPAKISSEAPF